MSRRIALSWSSGKDSAWCLHRLRGAHDGEVATLVTTVTPRFDRVSVHGTHSTVLRAQADALGLPLETVELPYPCSNAEYETAMRSKVEALVARHGVTHMAFGDLFLEDIRRYREALLDESGVAPLFPLWGLDTGALGAEMVAGGLEAVIVSAPEPSPVADLVGTRWDPAALAGLPDVDPCGENGEFHSCVIAMPGMERIDVEVGEVVRREGAVYADVILANGSDW